MTKELLHEIICELQAMERLVQKNYPEFKHPLVTKLMKLYNAGYIG